MSDLVSVFGSGVSEKHYLAMDTEGKLYSLKSKSKTLDCKVSDVFSMLQKENSFKSLDQVSLKKIEDSVSTFEMRYQKHTSRISWKLGKIAYAIFTKLHIAKRNPYREHEKETQEAIQGFKNYLKSLLPLTQTETQLAELHDILSGNVQKLVNSIETLNQTSLLGFTEITTSLTKSSLTIDSSDGRSAQRD